MLNNTKKGIVMIITLILVLAGVLTLGILKDKNSKDDNQDNYSANIEETKTEETEDVKEKPQTETAEEVTDFYGKLKNKEALKVLILGDGLALSQGSTSNNGVWDTGVVNLIKNTYGNAVEMVSLAKAKATTLVGLSVVNNNKIENYDLVITCFGHNDNMAAVNINDFEKNYSEMITQIKKMSPNATILPVLPSTLALDNNYRRKIQEVATENSLTCVDTKTAFANSGLTDAELLNGTLPNDTGYKLYTQTVGETIKTAMK